MKTSPGRADQEVVSAIRAHFEDELADAQMRMRVAPRHRAGSWRRPIGAMLAIAAALVVVAATALTVVRSTASPVPGAMASAAAVPSASSPAVPTATPSPFRPSYLAGPVGLNGNVAWMNVGSGIRLSQDGGRNWSPILSPVELFGASGSSIVAISGSPGRGFWIAFRRNDQIFFSGLAWPDVISAWSTLVPLVPSWPAWTQASGPPDQVTITPGPGKLVVVTERAGLGTFSAATTLFISTDDGKTFVRRPPTPGVSNSYWHWVLFTSPMQGVAAIGAGTGDVNSLIYTSDGGLTWARASVSGLPSLAWHRFERPAMVGARIVIPVTSWSDDGGLAPFDHPVFELLVSVDNGATFAATGTSLPVDGPLPVSNTLELDFKWATWLVPGSSAGGGHTIYESGDAGQTWTAVRAPDNVSIMDISLTGRTSATAVLVDLACVANQTNCSQATYLAATTDGGRTWVNP